MEFIKGDSLYDKVTDINNNASAWRLIQLDKKLIIVDYILQFVNIIERLHQTGYIHRDITPVNFLVDKKHRLYLIDNELSYSIKLDSPTPPFEAGTHGFMSPEQIAVKKPTIKEDIYGLAATIVNIFTGLSPLVFQGDQGKVLFEKLLFFIEEKEIAKEMTSALNFDPLSRPSISQIKQTVEKYQAELMKENQNLKVKESIQPPDTQELILVINSALKGLSSEPTVLNDDLWYSRSILKEFPSAKLQNEFIKKNGFAEGIAGVLYILSRAKRTGFKIESCFKGYQKGWQHLSNNCFKNPSSMPGGLYGGSAGIALSLKSSIETGLTEITEEIKNILAKCFSQPTAGTDLAAGVAGQGVALLQCRDFLEEGFYNDQIIGCINLLLNAQQKTGHWISLKTKNSKSLPASSFTYGNTGITWFLLEFISKFKSSTNQNVMSAIHKSIKLLQEQIRPLKKIIKTYGLRKTFSEATTWDSLHGMIMVFIKAYEVFRTQQYKLLAEDLLFELPENMIYDNFYQENGLSSIGEVYLEASRVLMNDEWKDRADWIANFFLKIRIENSNGYCYWLANNSALPTADLMTGNGGIVHFLMRYCCPKEIGYRLLQ